MILLAPNIDLALLVVRLALGVIFLAHGPVKLIKTKEMAAGLGLSATQVRGIGLMEVVGSLLVIGGVWEQIGAALLGIVMLGAIYFKTQKWGKDFTGENGWEFEFMLLAGAVAVLLAGGGAYALL